MKKDLFSLEIKPRLVFFIWKPEIDRILSIFSKHYYENYESNKAGKHVCIIDLSLTNLCWLLKTNLLSLVIEFRE